MSEPSSPLELALDYGARGWRVIPLHHPLFGEDDKCTGCSCQRPDCDAIGKHPRINDWVNAASVDPAVVRHWFGKWPDANVGIVTGAASGFIVLDVDTRYGGDETLAALCRTYGWKLDTIETITGSGGAHVFLKHPGVRVGNVQPAKDGAGILGPGLDVRGDGGMIVAPGSRHASGRRYEWECSSEPDDTPLAPCPPELVQLLTQRPTGEAGRLVLPDKIREGKRNDLLFRLACANRGHGFELPELLGVLTTANQLRCEPPLAATEVEEIAKGVVKRYAKGRANGASWGRPDWTDADAPPEPGSQPTPPGFANIANIASNDLPVEWESPIPFHEYQLPQFPAEVLPPWLRDFVTAEAEATQTPLDLAGMLALSALAAACARKVRVKIRDDWEEPLNLFVVVALAPANRKSAVFQHVVKPLEAYEENQARAAAPEIAAALTRFKIVESRLQKAHSDAAKAKLADRERLEDEAEALARQLAALDVPEQPRLLADDTSPERLATLLRDQKGRMAVMSPEGGVFDLMAGRYGQNGSPNFEVFLKGHAGDTLRVDRVGRPAEYVPQPALTMGLAVQPEVIRALADKPGFRGRGLLGRFLYSLPHDLLGRRKSCPLSMPEGVKAEYSERLTALLCLPIRETEDGEAIPFFLRLDAGARERLEQFSAWMEPKLGEFGELGNLSDWAGKLAGTVVRIAGLLHLAEAASSSTSWKTIITADTMVAAIRIGRYLIPHAEAAYALMGADPVVGDAKHILAWIKRQSVEEFTQRQLFEGVKGRFKRVEGMRSALDLLVSHHYLREKGNRPTGGKGRPAGPGFLVNPYSHNSQYSQKAGSGEELGKHGNGAEPPGALDDAEDLECEVLL